MTDLDTLTAAAHTAVDDLAAEAHTELVQLQGQLDTATAQLDAAQAQHDADAATIATLSAQVTDLQAQLQAAQDAGAPAVTITTGVVSDSTAAITWQVDAGTNTVDGVYVARDGASTGGSTGGWETPDVQPADGSLDFQHLYPNTDYTLTVTPVVAGVRDDAHAAAVTVHTADGVAPVEPAPSLLPDTTLFGVSMAGDAGGRTKVPGARVYLGPGDTPADVSGSVADAIAMSTAFVWLSAKDTTESWLRAYLPKYAAACKAAGLLPVFTSNHEPDGGDSVCDPTRYHAGWDVAAPVCKAEGILSATILTSSKGDFQKDGPGTWEPYYRADVDLHGFDRYNLGALSGADSWNDPATICQRIVDWYRSKDATKPLAVGETGASTGYARQAEWATAMRDWCLSAGVAVSCWYDARITLLTDAAADAWLA